MPTVREARAEDAQDVVDVVRRSIEQLCVADHRNDPDTLSRWLANKTPEMFQIWLANPDNHCLVALSGERLLGVALLRRDGQVVLFYLAPGTQRQGVGTLLYRALEQKARQWGLDRLHLGSTFMARSFYEAMGFRSTGPAKKEFGAIESYPYEKALR